MRRSRLIGVGALCAVVALAPACARGGNDSGGKPISSLGTLAPDTKGDECNDKVGDLATASDTGLASPPGIDIVNARAELSEDSLKVRFEMAGPITTEGDPIYVVAQGDPGREVSFEVRATPKGASQWGLLLITFRGGETRKGLDAPVTVSGNVLSYEVPRKSLAPVATLLWQFGASADSGPITVFDDCNSLSSSSPTVTRPSGSLPPTGAPGSSAPGSTAPPESPPPVPMGTPLGKIGSNIVTVHELKVPATNRKLDPAPEAGKQVVAADVEVCAGEAPVSMRTENVKVKTADNRQYDVWPTPQTIVDPPLPTGQLVPKGQCLRGWLAFQVPSDAKPAQVTIDTSGSGAGPFLTWLVA